ncbi:hypothetical protein [Acaryochloris sp. IP29b_bin.137]|uniref:hypothetical protein n=1 Tax=Acaryochloris sp. IP29b_bin.137 TaxID=2969217 RepID=UPI002606A622|nr:hypothetical protein [Acaryochloris sp. IP29b_bin.137]
MSHIEKIRCPNCGSPHGERHHIENLTRTQCLECDYLLVTDAVTGEVVEAYAPGLYMSQASRC